jgi:hypothetical protein
MEKPSQLPASKLNTPNVANIIQHAITAQAKEQAQKEGEPANNLGNSSQIPSHRMGNNKILPDELLNETNGEMKK